MLCCYVSDYTQNGMKDRCLYAFDFATVGRMSEVGCLEWRDVIGKIRNDAFGMQVRNVCN